MKAYKNITWRRGGMAWKKWVSRNGLLKTNNTLHHMIK
jgi:hypothetical protein